MTTPVLLNNVDHAGVRVATGHAARFGDAVNQTRVFPTEFEALQRDYAIVLRRDATGAFAAYALLGIDRDENLFLDEERWDARCVPALHARGPFSIGVPRAGEPGDPMIHIDLAHPRIDPDGAPVFLDHGGNAPLLDRALDALRRIYAGTEMAPALYAALDEAGLIAPVTLQLDLAGGRRVEIVDTHTISLERLAALDGAALERLHRLDALRAAVWLASSLGNIPLLLDRKLRRDGAR